MGKRIRAWLKSFSTAAMAVAQLSLAPTMAAPAPKDAPAPRDAREQAPAGLIGLWKADFSASTFAGAKPQALVRSFAYSEDGKILVNFWTLGTSGNLVAGHWAAQVDGTPAIEYHSSTGSIAFNVVSLKKIDDTSLALTVTRHGKVDIEATYKLSPDAKTLTYSYGGNTIVYRPWNFQS